MPRYTWCQDKRIKKDRINQHRVMPGGLQFIPIKSPFNLSVIPWKMADGFAHVGKENCSEPARRGQVSGPCSQFQRSFIQRVTLLGRLPTSFVLHREKKQKVAAILGIDQDTMKSLPEGDLQDCLLSKVSRGWPLLGTPSSSPSH